MTRPHLLAAILLVNTAAATELLFERTPAFVPMERLPEIYGDRVEETNTPGFGFRYGSAGGWTPNVSVSYNSSIKFWPDSYGDLTNVLYCENLSSPLRITLRADQGYVVRLNGFDLAAWNGYSSPRSLVINSVRVLNERGEVMPGSQTAPAFVSHTGRSAFNFSTPISGRELTIEVDATNLRGPVTWADSVGIDNVRFSQAAVTAPVQATYYVSPEGSDDNPGTATEPFRTLEKARDAVRLINGSMTGDIHVVLWQGVYELAQTFTLLPVDSGTNGFNVIYRAAPGERVIISGGRSITGWSDADGNGIWQAPNVLGINTRQLYVEGQRRQRAHGPVKDKLTWIWQGYSGAVSMIGWRNASDMEFVYDGIGDGIYLQPRLPIQSIQSNGTVIMQNPAWRNVNDRVWDVAPPLARELPDRVENALELLDEPGEWYLDRVAGVFHYKPYPGENPNSVEITAAVLEQLVTGTGTVDNPIHNIHFTGIQFSYATWMGPSSDDGLAEVGANGRTTGVDGVRQGAADFVAGGTYPYGDTTEPLGNLSFAFAHDLRFERNRFTHLGGAALNFWLGAHYNEIVGNVFTDISSNGIQIGDDGSARPADERVIPLGNQIRSNHFYNLGAEYAAASSINIPYSRRTLVAHNQINDMPNTGLIIGGGAGWHESVVPNVNRENRVHANVVSDHMQVLHDGGGIYVQSWQGTSIADGAVIDGNIVRDQNHKWFPIYMDQGARYFTQRNNATFDNDFPFSGTDTLADTGGCAQPGIDPNTGKRFVQGDIDLQYNYHEKTYLTWYCLSNDRSEDPKNVLVANNTRINGIQDVPAWIVASAGVEPSYRDIVAGEPLRRLEIAPAAGGGVKLVFPTKYMWDYRIEATENLVTPFSEIARVFGTGSETEWIDLPVTPKRFYRVIERVP